MKYKLINDINKDYSAIEQVLVNRGIPHSDIFHYLNTTDADILEPEDLGIELLDRAATMLSECIGSNSKAVIIVDCDCDGFTSAAVLINYLHTLFPQWTEENVSWILHEGKQHGLADCYEAAAAADLIIVPDAGTNDWVEHNILAEHGKKIIILDHHEAEIDITQSPAVIINNQTCSYANKQLSGVGVTWQFCRYLDKILDKHIAHHFIDLVALGLTADMMSLKSTETKHLILKGLKGENIRNPFIWHMAEKNRFSLGERITPMGAAFYIAPFVNAMVRSGTQEEKELLFQSMLTFKANQEILSNKRGHKAGEMEKLVEQAVRTATNVKNRQTRAQDAGMATLEKMIESKNLLDHKVLLFLLEPNQVESEIRGLIANKLMAKYQRPCCILTRIDSGVKHSVVTEDGMEIITTCAGDDTYSGSARGCDKTGIRDFKDLCAEAPGVSFVAGHQGAFGLGIAADQILDFLEYTDKALEDTSDEPVYYVDYIYSGTSVTPDHILNIAQWDDLWGKDLDEPYLAIEKLKVTADMVTVYSKKNLTLKITLPNKVSLMLFDAPQDLCVKLQNDNPGYIEINVVGRANRNEWNGYVTPQLFIEDLEIVGQSRYYF